LSFYLLTKNAYNNHDQQKDHANQKDDRLIATAFLSVIRIGHYSTTSNDLLHEMNPVEWIERLNTLTFGL
jgi:hypothetical protein